MLCPPIVAICVRMHTAPPKFDGEKRLSKWGGTWHRDVRLGDGRLILVGVRQGNPARGMYGVKGFVWNGLVQDKSTSQTLWSGRVNKSTGASRLLELARLVPCHKVCKEPAYAHWTHSELCDFMRIQPVRKISYRPQLIASAASV